MKDGCTCSQNINFQSTQVLNDSSHFRNQQSFFFTFGCPVHQWEVKHDFIRGEYSIYLAYVGQLTNPEDELGQPVIFYFMVTDSSGQLLKRRDFTRILKLGTFYGYPMFLSAADIGVKQTEAEDCPRVVFPLKVTTNVTLLRSMKRKPIIGGYDIRDDIQHHDVTLKLQDGELKASKFMLATSNEYFARLFSNGMKETSQQVIELPECTAVISVLLDYIYTKSLDVPTNLYSDVYLAADKYGFDIVSAHIIFAVNEKIPSSVLIEMLRTVWNVGKKKHKEHLLETVTRSLKVLLLDQEFSEFIKNGECGVFMYDLVTQLSA